MSWITGREAADILSTNSGRPISTDYVRALANKGFIRSRVNPKKISVKQYWLEDVQNRKVYGRTEKRPAPEEDEHKPVDMAV